MYYIYRYYDAPGHLLYLGITTDFEKRDRMHRLGHRKLRARGIRLLIAKGLDINYILDWFLLIARASVYPCKVTTLKEALAMEREAIREEQPLYNVAHNA